MPQEYALIVIFGMLAILMYYAIRNVVSYYTYIPYFYRKRLKRKYKMTPERDKELENFVADSFLEVVDQAYLEGKVTNDERYYLYEKYAKVWAIQDLKPGLKDTPPWEEVSTVKGLSLGTETPERIWLERQPRKKKSLKELFNGESNG